MLLSCIDAADALSSACWLLSLSLWSYCKLYIAVQRGACRDQCTKNLSHMHDIVCGSSVIRASFVVSWQYQEHVCYITRQTACLYNYPNGSVTDPTTVVM